MICGRKRMNNINHLVKKNKGHYRFPEAKLAMYIERFSRIGGAKGFSQDQFRENMGLLGLDSTCLIADRIFRVMNKSRSGTVILKEYLEYMDILRYGTPYEKSEQSFKLITNLESDGITFEDFVDWIVNIWKMYNTLTGCEINSTSDDIRYYFDKLDRQKDGVIDLDEYREAMVENKNLYEWFEFANKGIAQDDTESEIDEETFKMALQMINKDVSNCLDIMTKDKRNSRISNLTYGHHALSDRPSLVSYGVEEEKDDGNMIIESRPNYNKGDDDTPEEILLDEESRISINPIQSSLLEILHKLEKYTKNNDEEIQMESQSKSETPMAIQRLKSSNNGKIGHTEWNLIYNMVIGIQKSVKIAMYNFKSTDDFTPSLFWEKSDIPLMQGNALDSSNLFKFKDYASLIFERLRREYEISSEDYIASLNIEKIVNSIIVNDFNYFAEKITQADKGHFFCSTDDEKFLLKTISSREFKQMRKMLTDYFYHMVKNHNSFIAKIVGLHRVKSQTNKKYYFIVMCNIFKKELPIGQIYDLQGIETKENFHQGDKFNVKKDQDFNNKGVKIQVGDQLRGFVINQLKKDFEFLCDRELVEYSFVVGTHEMEKGMIYKDIWVNQDSSIAYFMGIVDFMNKYGKKKKIKGMFRGKDKEKRLVIPPKEYCDRILAYLERNII